MSTHAFSSPSAAGQSEKCPAAPFRRDAAKRRSTFALNYIGYRNPKVKSMFTEDNAAADSGTFLHDQQEGLLKHGIPLDGIEDAFERDGIQRICDDIKAEMDVATAYGIEDRLFNDGVDSFGSADFWATLVGNLILADDVKFDGKWLHVRDLKTGRTEVQSEGNSQGLRYGCGVMEKLGWPEDIEYVKITIDAFRFPSSSWVITRQELLDYWNNTFRPAMLANNRLNPPAVAGDHCTFCDARVHCAEFLEWADQPVKQEVYDNEFQELDTEYLEDVYLRATQMKDTVDALKAELVLRSEASDFTGDSGLSKLSVKAGATKKYLKRGEEDTVKELLTGVEGAFETKLRSPSALVKLVKDDLELADKLGHLIVENQNKPSLVIKK